MILNPHEYSEFIASEPKFTARFEAYYGPFVIDNKTGHRWITFGTEEFDFAKVERYVDCNTSWAIPTIEELKEIAMPIECPINIDPIFRLNKEYHSVWSCDKENRQDRALVFNYNLFQEVSSSYNRPYQCLLIKRHDS